MKKTLALIFSMTLACCAFTACGDDSKSSSSEAEKATEAITDNKNHTNSSDSSNGIEEIITDAESVVDGLVSEGEKIVDNADSAINGSNNDSTTSNASR